MNSIVDIIDNAKVWFLNDTIFNIDSIKFLSNINRNKSIVISVETNKHIPQLKGKCFVIKYTGYSNIPMSRENDKYFDMRVEDFYSINKKNKNEYLLYKYLCNLIKHDIVPFVYYGYSRKILNDNNPELLMDLLRLKDISQFINLDKEKLNELKLVVQNEITRFTENTNILILESDICTTETKDLNDYIIAAQSQPLFELHMLVILFHILYTLKIFHRLGIKHNDLHLSNILIISDNISGSFNKYITTNNANEIAEFIIPNIGVTTRIFDFDLSNVSKVDEHNLQEKIKPSKYLSEFDNLDYSIMFNEPIVLNNENNIMYDLLKILCIIRDNLSLVGIKNQKLKSFFHNINYITQDEIKRFTKLGYIDEFNNFIDPSTPSTPSTPSINTHYKNRILSFNNIDYIIKCLYDEIKSCIPPINDINDINIIKKYSMTNLYNNTHNTSTSDITHMPLNSNVVNTLFSTEQAILPPQIAGYYINKQKSKNKNININRFFVKSKTKKLLSK